MSWMVWWALAMGADAVPTVRIVFAVAVEAGVPVIGRPWIDERMAEANRLYAGVPLRFRAEVTTALPERFARITSRADRDAVVGQVVAGAINVRVTGALADVDDGSVRRGVHWRLRADRRQHVIILSKIAAPSVLGHELGHYFGNGHSVVDDNLMSYGRTGAPIAFDDAQIAMVRRALRGYLVSGELVARP